MRKIFWMSVSILLLSLTPPSPWEPDGEGSFVRSVIFTSLEFPDRRLIEVSWQSGKKNYLAIYEGHFSRFPYTSLGDPKGNAVHTRGRT